MRETISGPDTIPAHRLGSVARALTFADATPAVPHRVKEDPIPSALSSDGLASTIDARPARRSKSSRSTGSAIRVVLRVRPLSERERKTEPTSCVSRSEKNQRTVHIRPANAKRHPLAVRNAGHATFKFAEIFDEISSQSTVFERTALPMIEGLFQGQSAVVFAHGVTCSGKTWTIQGSGEHPGILPRALDVIVNSIAVAKGKGLLQESIVSESVALLTSDRREGGGRRTRTRTGKNAVKTKVHDSNYIEVDGDMEYKIFASYLEVYNEQCYDLFEKPPDSGAIDCHVQGGSEHEHSSEFNNGGEEFTSVNTEPSTERRRTARTRRKILKLKMNREKEVYADGITEIEISNCADIDRLLEFGQQNRSVAHTKANEVSSRSHAVFFITLKMTETSKQSNGQLTTRHRTSKLSIVDLAGSERTGRTNNSPEGVRQRETNKINSSLMNLGRCLQVMRYNQRMRKTDPSKKLNIVPFRDSRLTHLLQHCLEAGSAVMIANVSPAMHDSDETIQALRCAAIAQEVTIGPSKKKAVFTDRTNLMGNRIAQISSTKKLRSSTRKQAGRNLRSRGLEARDLAIANSILKPRASESSSIIAAQKRDNAFLRMELEEERCARLDLERVKTQVEEELLQENDLLFRQNERLKDRLADSEARLCVVETEVREELAEGAEQMLQRVQEHYQNQMDELRRENDELCETLGRDNDESRSRISLLSHTERKEQAESMAARLARRASKAAFDGIRISLADCEQNLDLQAGGVDEWESEGEDYVEEGDVENYIEESD